MVSVGAQPGCRPRSPQPWPAYSTTTALPPSASGPGPPSPPRGLARAVPLSSMVLAGGGRGSSSAVTATLTAQPSLPSQAHPHIHAPASHAAHAAHVIAQSWPGSSQQQASNTGIGTHANTTTNATNASNNTKTKAKASSRHIHSPSSSSISTSTATTFSTSNSTSTWVSSPSASSIASKSTSIHSPSSSVTSSPSRPGSSFSVLNRSLPLPVLSVIPPPGENSDNNRGSGFKREARRPVMQRVSAFLPSWDKRNSNASTNSRPGLFGWSSNRSSTSNTTPNALAKLNTHAANGRVQREAFWPATLDRECEKAARILKSFSTDGYLAPLEDEDQPPANIDPKTPIRITKKIPRRIIQNAAGIAIFTCMRSGLWMTGSGGSGILIARKSDGTWSPPSGIMLHTPTLSFIIGVDIYDCVLVVNNLAALESITKPRVTLGEDVGLIGGPLVSLDSDEAHIKWQDLGNTVFTYLKARGQTQVVNLNGCILTERGNENERFYESSASQMDILAGNVARHVEETKPLFEVIKMAEGRTDYEAAVIRKMEAEVAPGDAMIATPKSSSPASPRGAFGIPNADDPDPFGVLALEMAGLEIREAGSKLRPASSQFDFNPTPSSPAFSKFNRQSIDTYATRSNRGSYMSQRTVKSTMTDAGTQTDVGNTPETTPSPGQSDDGHRASSVQMPNVTEEDEEVDYTKVDLTPLRHLSGTQSAVSVISHSSTTPVDQDRLQVDQPTSRDDADKASSNYDLEDDDKSSIRDVNDEENLADEEDEDEDDDDDEEEEPVVFEVAAVQPTRIQAVSRVVHAKGSMVTIPKRIPPPLPMRSPARVSRSSKSEIGDVANLKSPLRQTHTESDLQSDDEAQDMTENGYLTPPTSAEKEAIKDTNDDVQLSDDSDVEFFMAEEAKIDQIKLRRGSQASEAKKEDVKSDDQSEAKGLPPSSSQNSLTVPEAEHGADKDSVSKKHTSSVYTGTTEDRWSFDGSSLTTPTSDRPYSVVDEIIDDETPRKPTREAEKHEVQEKDTEVEKMGSKEPTPAPITVA